MPNLRSLNIVPLVLLVLLVPVSHYYPALLWWGFGLIVLIQLTIVVYGCINISSGYFLTALCSAKTDEKVVALTFDDGPHPTYTTPILDTLKQYNAPATFFCIGKNIAGNEALLTRERSEGHIVANHSFCHDFWFDMYGSKKILADLQQADTAIEAATGSRPLLFRPPYGVTNPNVAKAVRKGKYVPIGWNIRSLDTAANDKQKLLSRISDQIRPGAIILLHDSMEITAAMLPELIETIKNKGYEITALDKMLNIRAYA